MPHINDDTSDASDSGSADRRVAPIEGFRRRSGELFGLAVALGLTTAFWWPPIASRLLPRDLVWRNVAAQAVDWLFCIVLIGVVLVWERRPLSSLGFKRLTMQNFSAGLGLGGFAMVGLVLWKFAIAPMLPDMSFTSGVESSPGSLPDHFFYWYAPFALATASLCEEVIYRGYAMERLLLVTKRPWIAVLASHIAFVLYHLKDGIENVLCFSVLLLLFPLYYIRYRDLTMVIVAHAFIDLMAIIGHAAGIRG